MYECHSLTANNEVSTTSFTIVARFHKIGSQKRAGSEAITKPMIDEKPRCGQNRQDKAAKSPRAVKRSKEGKDRFTDAMTNSKTASQRIKKKREVQVVSAPTEFPISTSTKAGKRKRSTRDDEDEHAKKKHSEKPPRLLDWHDTAKEIREFGATAFVGKQKRDFQDEQYFALTGRHQKKPKTPLPILRGIKKAAAKREAKQREEARQAGIVLPKAKKAENKSSSTYKVYGPAPNIGFMKGGVFRVKKKQT
eukprot:scaffold22586_cov138-Cylindrotheca_fusiformis.AAC.15